MSKKKQSKKLPQPKLEKHYNIAETEQKMQKLWASKKHYQEIYSFKLDDTEKPLFAIDTPPPFTSGILHMGHAYWCSISDLIARYKRMRGYNVLLPQGWDTQGLPTELKVQYKWNIPREDRQLFKDKCREWTELMIKDMKDVIYQIGYRPAWEDFEYRTMDPEYQTNVQQSLIQMYEAGDVYVDSFPNMWCTYCGTSIAQAETGYLEKRGFMNWVKFPLVDDKDNFIEIATTRPELIPACQAILIHPKDKRYKDYHNKKVTIPIVGREIPIILDKEVDMEFGTGAVMNCTFGDEQDIKWQQRHNLPITSIISPDGKITNTGLRYDGMKIGDAQREMAIDLNKQGFMSKQERIKHRVLCHTERGDCETPMEFLTTKQYMVRIKDYAPELLKAAKRMNWYPSLYQKRATDWIGALEWDWIISRQRVFGTPIPFWSCSDCNEVIPPPKGTEFPLDTSIIDPPVMKCPKCGSEDIKGTEDVCDCWVDSSLTALIITKWFSDPDFAKNWITKDSEKIIRLQGHDIIRTWYTYTTFRTMKLTDGLLPFGNVLINGHVKGPDSLKMSKSRGNVVDPRDGIQKYGADAIRQTILSRKVGTDFPFQWDTAEYGRSFLQKLWSVSRFLSTYIEDIQDVRPTYSPIDHWLLNELENARKEITDTMDNYEFHTGLKIIYDITWTKLCDNYLESVKQILRTGTKSRIATVKQILRDTLWAIIRMLAPFVPHITDEIYLKMFKESDDPISIHGTTWPVKEKRKINSTKAKIGEQLIEIIAQTRQQKAKMRIALNQPIAKATIVLPEDYNKDIKKYQELIKMPTHITEINFKDGSELSIELQKE